MSPDDPRRTVEACQDVLESSRRLLSQHAALLRHDFQVGLRQGLRHVACNAAALWCAGVALICGTAALYLYFSTFLPPYLAAAGLGALNIGAAALLHAAPRAPAALHRAQENLEQATDALRCTPPIEAPPPPQDRR